MRHRWVLALVALAVAAGACGDDDGGSSGDEPSEDGADVITGPDPDSVRVFTSDEICALVPADSVGDALGLTIDEAEAVVGGTPQCSYSFTTADGTLTNVVLAVQRPVEDLGSRAGEAGYQAAIDANLAFASEDAATEEVLGVGDGAVWLAGPANSILIAYGGDQIVTVSGPQITQEQGGLLGGQLLSSLG